MKTNYCGEWITSEVLPDEDGNCSLCGSPINVYGECQYVSPAKKKQKALDSLDDLISEFGDYPTMNISMERLVEIRDLIKPEIDALQHIKDEAEKPSYVRDNEYILAKANVALGLTSQGKKKL